MYIVLSVLILLIAVADLISYLHLSRKILEFAEKHDRLVSLVFGHIFDKDEH